MWTKRTSCFILFLVGICCSEDQLFMIETSEPNEYFCITNSSYGLSWIVDEPLENEAKVSEFLPFGGKSGKVECKNPPSGKWECVKEISDDVILDRRWEEFTIHRSNYVDPDNNLIFTNVLHVSSVNFKIPLSIRIWGEAHLFLCDGSNIPRSNCYWFMLQAFHGNKTAIRKCSMGTIPIENDLPSQCQTVSEIEHESAFKFLSENTWNHFVLSKANEQLSLSKVGYNHSEIIINYNDKNMFRVTNILIHNKVIDQLILRSRLWKFHEVEYFKVTKHIEKEIIGTPILVNDDRICISMFIKTCKTCQIKLEVEFRQETIYDIYSGNEDWHEIRISSQMFLWPSKTIQVNLLITTLSTTSTPQKELFWFFSNVKQCHDKNFRMISLKYKARCETISSTKEYVTTTKEKDSTDNFCKEDSVSNACIPCSWFNSNDCGKLKLYGKKLPMIIFKNPPAIETVTFTTAKIRVHNFDVINTAYKAYPFGFQIQYRVMDTINQEWITVPKYCINFNNETNIELPNLKENSNYTVRCIIRANDGKSYKDDMLYVIPSTSFKTKCDGEPDVRIYPSNTTVNITLEPNTCNIVNLEIEIPGVTKTNSRQISNLNPFTDYKIICHLDSQIVKKVFKTMEGVPEMVEEFYIKSTTSNSVLVAWKKSNHINGVLQHYTVEYNVAGCIYFKFKNTTKETSMFIDNLFSNTNYTFSLYVTNTYFQSEPNILSVRTEMSGVVEDNEIPRIVSLKPSSHSVEVELGLFNCMTRHGLSKVKFLATCILSSYPNCDKNVKEQEFDYLQGANFINITGLLPFSKYRLLLKLFFDNDSNKEQNVRISFFNTSADVPDEVTDILIYSKNDNSMSLRLKPPPQNNGILESYCISYSYDTNNFCRLNVEVRTCDFWTHYHCVTVNRFIPGKKFNLTIRGKNKDVPALGKPETIETQMPPFGGLNVSLSWTLESDLILIWNHPPSMIGTLKSFKVLVNSVNVSSTYPFKLKNLSSSYTFKIPAQNLSLSTLYEISVLADDGFITTSSCITTLTPPSFLSFEGEPERFSSYTTIIIRLPPKIKNLDMNDEYESKLFILINDHSEYYKIHDGFEDLSQQFGVNLHEFKILYECDLKLLKKWEFMIGKKNHSIDHCLSKDCVSLKSGTDYNITFILKNSYSNQSSYKITFFICRTSSILTLAICLTIIGLSILAAVLSLLLLWYTNKNETIRNVDEVPMVANNVMYSYNEEDLNSSLFSKPIDVKLFTDYVKTGIDSKIFIKQHKSIQEQSESRLYENPAGELFWEHINLHSSQENVIENEYIISELPNEENIEEFWKLIWNENVENVVLLTDIYNNQEKQNVGTIFPSLEPIVVGDIALQLISSNYFNEYEEKIIKIHFHENSREIFLLCYPFWTNYRLVPPWFFTPFLQKMEQIPITSNSPLVILTSHRTTATGFILLCDICLRSGNKYGVMDTLNTLYRLAKSNMLIPAKLYVLAHLVLVEKLNHVNTAINCRSDSLTKWNVFNKINSDLSHLKFFLWLDSAAKDLYFEVEESHVPSSTHFTSVIRDTYFNKDILNTTIIDGVTVPAKFIVTTTPKKASQIEHFWQLVEDKNVPIIYALDDNFEKIIWSLNGKEESLYLSEDKCVTHKETTKFTKFRWVTVQLESGMDKKQVEMFIMKDWNSKTDCPNSVHNFVNFYIYSNKISKDSSPQIVTCCDGRKVCGIYLAFSYLMEKIRLEGVCDIYSAVRYVKYYNQEFLKSDEQLLFLHKAIKMYLRESQTYETVL